MNSRNGKIEKEKKRKVFLVSFNNGYVLKVTAKKKKVVEVNQNRIAQ